MSADVSMQEILPIIEEVLACGGEISFTPNGVSMWPMLRNGKDIITIRASSRPLKKYDVPLYKNEEGKFILHRYIRKNKQGYVMRGDNCLDNEYGIKREQIIGIMTSFVRNGKKYNCSELEYKLYCIIRCNELMILLRKLKREIITKIRKPR